MCRLHESGRVVLYLVALALLVGAVTNAVRSQGFLNLGSYGHSSLRHAVRNHAPVVGRRPEPALMLVS